MFLMVTKLMMRIIMGPSRTDAPLLAMAQYKSVCALTILKDVISFQPIVESYAIMVLPTLILNYSTSNRNSHLIYNCDFIHLLNLIRPMLSLTIMHLSGFAVKITTEPAFCLRPHYTFQLLSLISHAYKYTHRLFIAAESRIVYFRVCFIST